MFALATAAQQELTEMSSQTQSSLKIGWSNYMKTINGIPSLVSAILTRILFVVHGFFAIFLVVKNKDDASQWWPVFFLFLLLIESAYTILVRRGEEYKYFWPSCFLYIMSVLPSVWTMEIDMYYERSKEQDLQMTDVSSSNSSLVNADGEKDIWGNLSKQTIAEKVGALGLTIGIIIGRWLLPRGAITREQLSALLIVYVGIAADILEVFELFDEENIMYNQSITIATLFVFSWCLLSFCLVTTATTRSDKQDSKRRTNKVSPMDEIHLNKSSGDGKLKDEYIKRLQEEWRKSVDTVPKAKNDKTRDSSNAKERKGFKAVREVFSESEKRQFELHGDIYGILTGIFMMDGPFFVFRLYCMVQYSVDSEMHIFYTVKNAISLALLVYRLCILTCKGEDEEDDVFEKDEDKLRNVQVAVVGTQYKNFRK